MKEDPNPETCSGQEQKPGAARTARFTSDGGPDGLIFCADTKKGSQAFRSRRTLAEVVHPFFVAFALS